MDLVAHEPLVCNPVAAEFDENGQLYVCEMIDYPYRPKEGDKPLGRVRLLRDSNGDGVFDESHVFADGVVWATGVVPWKGGVYVASAPDIWYVKDTDGDFKADVRTKAFTGFGTQNQQATLNNLRYGLDHMVYGSTGPNGGKVHAANESESNTVSVTGRDFRFDPQTHRFETITGTIQFGNSFDDWGNRFLCHQSRPLYQEVLPQHYLARNPYLPVATAVNYLAEDGPVPIFRVSPTERWRQIRSNRLIANQLRDASQSDVSQYTIDAASGVTVYRGAAYPKEFYGNAFIGDAQNNLVHRRILTPDGPTFTSRRADENAEFIRSHDNWFRPANSCKSHCECRHPDHQSNEWWWDESGFATTMPISRFRLAAHIRVLGHI
jgi:putative membrane-bound dehydrogenase-like protein